MPYERPKHSLSQIDKAGKAISEDVRAAEGIEVLNSWRVAHRYPLNALHMTLRNRSKRVDINAITAQRLKRLDSVVRKLYRQPTLQMSQMQDIGGCRAVFSNMTRVKALRFLYETNPLRHRLARTRDYIDNPKDDGYRSVHLIYRFVGKATSSPWNKLWIEIQLRTSLQHAWATAVETVDAFTIENLKFGAGSDDWRRFFQLVGALHARMEKTAAIPNVPATYDAIAREAKLLERKLGVIHRLEQYAHITQQITRKKRGVNFDWYVMQILPDSGRVIVRGFPLEAFTKAQESLISLEANFKGTKNQAVLVATASLNELRRAYPNYFADTKFFIEVLRSLVR
jgi:ppGpp synthetase/RelA/SpoT-type nucleotidyltranferase